MAYVKNIWVDDSSPDLEASNLNHMEQGIYDAHQIAGNKQDKLVSGETIKTINGNNLLGSGNIQIGGGGGGGADIIDDLESTRTDACLSANQGRVLNEKKQEKLKAGENITIDQTTNTISASGGSGGIPEAPADNKIYGRKNKEWAEVTGGGGGITLLDVYPVGSIYMSVNNENPATLFGGTWQAWGSGQVPVGVKSGDTDFGTAEKTGGSKDAAVIYHRHTVDNHDHSLNSHTHGISHNHSFTQPTVSGGSCTITSSGGHSHGVRTEVEAATGSAKRHVTPDGSVNTAIIPDNSGSHTHTVPNHSHTVSGGAVGSASTSTSGTPSQSNTGMRQPNTDYQGSSGTGKNLQPYITCYMWKRTA